MIEATYHRHHRRPMRIDESVVRLKMHVGVMCVCCAAVGHKTAEDLSCDGFLR
jgi:hypothetical protein